MPELSPEILFSNGNLAQSALALRPAEFHGRYAENAGYDGVEWLPLYRGPLSVVHAVHSGALALKSMHQTFRTNQASRNTNLPGGNKGSLTDRLIDSPLGRLIMPEVVASAQYISEVQHKIGEPVPAVFYPQEDERIDSKMRAVAGASKDLFQPTDHVARLVSAQSMEQLLGTMIDRRGYDGFATDSYHLRRRYGNDEPGVVSDPNALETLLVHSDEVHISLGRGDFAKQEPHIPTHKELEQAVTGDLSGYLADFLDGVKEHRGIGRVVVELSSRKLAPVAKAQGLSVQEGYAQIATNLRGRLAA